VVKYKKRQNSFISKISHWVMCQNTERGKIVLLPVFISPSNVANTERGKIALNGNYQNNCSFK